MEPNRVKIADQNEPKRGEEWVMECEITVSNGDRYMTFKGFATKDVVDAMLQIMKEMVE